MPLKVKAKDHSQYMRSTTHHNLTHLHQYHKPLNNWQKVLITLGCILCLAIILIGLALA